MLLSLFIARIFYDMKKIPLLSNLFSRSRSSSNVGTLETDAVPVDDPPENQTAQDSLNNGSMNSGDFNAALQLHNQMAESSDLMVAQRSNNQIVAEPLQSPTTITNNQMAVQNTQGQVVMQFSNVTGLQFGSNYTFNTGKMEHTLSSPENTVAPSKLGSVTNTGRPRRTRTIEAMMKSSEELDHRMIDCISTHLGEGWKSVFRDLDFTDGQIEQSVIDNQIQGGIKEVIYQLLLSWINNSEDGEATLGVITQLLWKSNHRECVQKMKEVWKTINSERTA